MPTPFVVAFVTGVTPGKWLRIWGERMPQSPIEARPTADADALRSLHDGTADVALLRLPIDDAGLSVIALYQEGAVVMAPKDHPLEAFGSVALADLAGENLLEGHGSDTVELVAANVGVAVMPQSVARVHSRRDVIARPMADAAETTIALVWVADRTTAEVEEFIGIVRGRTANSSRGRSSEVDPVRSRQARPAKAARPAKKKGKGRR